MKSATFGAALLIAGAAMAQPPTSAPTLAPESTGAERTPINEQTGAERAPDDRSTDERGGGGAGRRIEREQITGTRILRSDRPSRTGGDREVNRLAATPAVQAASARPGPAFYPPCSRTVTDRCIQTRERSARRR